jgi:hypothetical protein
LKFKFSALQGAVLALAEPAAKRIAEQAKRAKLFKVFMVWAFSLRGLGVTKYTLKFFTFYFYALMGLPERPR